ncbi:MAG: TonB-dependent receptor [Tannerella sp.]|jgi:TonB-linked SusC/RagA family outer membrane protein|nr:TonB-dependent receptor [Tannerella sp.]
MCTLLLSAQQSVTVTGTVTGANDEIINGANVVEKGTSNGAMTDANGKFSLNVSANAVLQVSFVGYLEQEIPTNGKSTFQIVLLEDVTALEEVVVIGYGTVKKSDLTGSVASVSSKQFKDQPVKRIEDILKGRAAGVEVTTTSGIPGASMKVRVRGTTSINKSSDPLYVVDGIVSTSGLNGLNPADIQSMELLKDASATAIYGSRGANGVILVTTRGGEAGKVQITADVQVGVSNVIKKYDLMDTYEHALVVNEVLGASMISAADMEAYKNGAKGTDWEDLMFQTGVSQDYKLNISGGTTKNRYLISGNLLDMTAVTITSKHQRAQLRVNLDNEIASWLTVSTKINASRIHDHNNGGVNFYSIFAYSPTMKDLKDEKTGVYYIDPINGGITGNPYSNRILSYNDNYQYNLGGNINLLFKIIDGLTLSVQSGGNYLHAPSYSFSSALVGPGARSSMGNSSNMNIYWQNTNNLTYQKQFGDHNITATAVWETSNIESTSMGISGSDLSNESVGYWNVGNAAVRNASNDYSAESIASGIGRLFYSYKGRYMLTGTFRADGSSKFQGDNKWGYFPSGSVAWDVAKEDFMSNQNLFQQLKIRLSTGVTGNQDIGRYSTLGMLSSTSYGYGTPNAYPGYWGNAFATPDVRWEKTYQYDAGIDISLLKGKVNFTADVFMKDTKDLLFQKSVPGYNGGGSYWVNQGEVKNSGVEFSLNVVPVNNKDFIWESDLNASYVKNEIVDLAGDDFILDANWSSWGGAMQIMKPGYPIGSFYLYEWKGFDDAGANLFTDILYDKDGNITGYGLTNEPTGDDQMIMEQVNPKWTFGWNNTFSYKNWSASLFINAATGASRINRTRAQLSTMSSIVRIREAYYNGWNEVSNKADAKYPSYSNPNNKFYSNSDFWLEDASFLKLKNVSVSYRIPKKIAKIADIQVSASAQNLLILTKYSGMDPEVYGSYVGTGIDDGAYPDSRTFTFGIRFNF